MNQWLGKLLGIDGVEAIHDVSIQFAAPWAAGRPVLVLLIAAALAAIAVVFYARTQFALADPAKGKPACVLLAALRGCLLFLLVVILADPIVSLSLSKSRRPLLIWLFDGTDSMNLQDKLSVDDVAALQAAIQDDGASTLDVEKTSRIDLVRRVLNGPSGAELTDLIKKSRVRAYLIEQLEEVREIGLAQTSDRRSVDLSQLADDLEAKGDVTALGSALDEIGRRHRSQFLAGVVVVSDFNQNAGLPALPAAERLGVPIYGVGVGPRKVMDLSVDLQAPPIMKTDERASVTVHLRQSGLTGQTARVQLFKRRLGSTGGAAQTDFTPAAPLKTVPLDKERVSLEISFRPEESGRHILEVRVEPLAGEVLEDNNRAQREVSIRDESLKLLFVEYEPTWEWRFMKEVFHRDKLVGREGFRTFLRSADFKVRRTNDLFLETLVRPRSEFFANDVIILSDIPADVLSSHFQEMLREYVEKFGGGLVVMAGPRFGTAALADTKIAEMLPVIIDSSLRRRDGQFAMQRTPQAAEAKFMQLGDGPAENELAWKNLGPLPWFQPVVRPHPLATVLANLPSERCVDDRTPQPVIASRRFGKGQVVYLGFNEFWRLRRIYGEKYYRQFWGQMINRLGLGRALGSQKRFQVYTDRQTYREGDQARFTVEAYNEDFEPLTADKLEARLFSDTGDAADNTSSFAIPLARDEVVFETSLAVFDAGRKRLLVRDPVTDEEVEANFDVAPLAIERRTAVRDMQLQNSLAQRTGGKAYELYELAKLAEDVKFPSHQDTEKRQFPVWNTWLVLLLVLALMLGEWLGRKLVDLR